MSETTTLNIRVNKDLKKQSEANFIFIGIKYFYSCKYVF